jgi:hypothetical protein
MEVKGSGAQGRHPRGGVRGKCRANARVDEQKPDKGVRRRTNRPLTAKSISFKSTERRSGGCVRKAVVLTSGDLGRVPEDGTEGIARDPDREQVKKSGILVKSPNGFPVLNPYLIAANQAIKKVCLLLGEFGMTPGSRSRIHAAVAGDEFPTRGRIASITTMPPLRPAEIAHCAYIIPQ